MSFAFVAESDQAVLESEEGVIFAHADVLTWKNIGASLASNNLPDLSGGSWGNLDAEILWV